MKYPTELGKWKIAARRSPQGECGLKCCGVRSPIDFVQSLPARGVWIEIQKVSMNEETFYKSLPARGVWIEIPIETD